MERATIQMLKNSLCQVKGSSEFGKGLSTILRYTLDHSHQAADLAIRRLDLAIQREQIVLY